MALHLSALQVVTIEHRVAVARTAVAVEKQQIAIGQR